EPGPGPIAPRRPVPQLANVTAIRWDGYSEFNTLTVKADQRLSRGVAFSVSYTLSKAIDDASDPARAWNCGAKSSICSIAPTSTCRTGSSGHSTSAECLVQARRAKCSWGSSFFLSASVGLNTGVEARVHLQGKEGRRPAGHLDEPAGSER